eukprot:233113_1
MVLACSLATSIFTMIYTLINLLLYLSTIYTIYKFCKNYQRDIDKNTPKLLSYSVFVFFISSLIILLLEFRNAMDICFHGIIDHLDATEWIYFIIFYGLQTYLLWLVLYLRLKYVFDGSEYSLSHGVVKFCKIVFSLIPMTAPFYLIIVWFMHDDKSTIILLSMPFVFIISFSCFLAFTFVHKLVQLFKTTETDQNRTNETCAESMLDNKLLSMITKSTILALVSLSMTVCTPISLLFGYYAISRTDNQVIHEVGCLVLAFITLADVYTNYLCILMSYNCFHKMYVSMCIKCDKKCKMYCIKKLSQKKRIMLGSRTMTPVDGGEGTNSETFKFSQSAENIVNGEIEDTHSNQIVHQTDSTNIYQQIDTVADEEIVIQT